MALRAGVSEWQTMQTQNLLPERACGFESHRRHPVKAPDGAFLFPFRLRGVSFHLILPPVQEPFPLVLSHVGIFQRAHVLWAGVAPSKALADLAAQVRQRLDSVGIPYDPQPFNPHITLMRKPVLPGEGLPVEIRPLPAEMTVREVCLYQSERRAEGMAYTVIGGTIRNGGADHLLNDCVD